MRREGREEDRDRREVHEEAEWAEKGAGYGTR